MEVADLKTGSERGSQPFPDESGSVTTTNKQTKKQGLLTDKVQYIPVSYVLVINYNFVGEYAPVMYNITGSQANIRSFITL